jgi:hypothetical protein
VRVFALINITIKHRRQNKTGRRKRKSKYVVVWVFFSEFFYTKICVNIFNPRTRLFNTRKSVLFSRMPRREKEEEEEEERG